ncbi:MAG: FliA/WhiG family RNA polymerase sigma factor [Chlamydiales bacterium]
MALEKEDLWKLYHEKGDTEHRDELIVQYLYLVKYTVGRLGAVLPTHIKLEDLYSSGVTGLIKAIEKFDPSKNSKFESYAILLIKGAIIDELRELDWIPRSVHQKANQIATAQETLQRRLGREPTDEELSAHLGVTEEEYEELLLRVRPAVLIPLNSEVFYGDEENATLLERIADTKAETSFEIANKKEVAHLLEEAISNLPEQERKVLTLYYYEELMLKEIGKIMGVSESRVSQIHTKALLKLRRLLINAPTLSS